MPASVNPWAHAVIDNTRKRKATGCAGRGTGRKKRVSKESTGEGSATGESAAGSNRGYARWDTEREEDNLTAEACLAQWMTMDDNWKKWKDAKSTGEKDKCYRSINAHLVENMFPERTKDSIQAKFKALEDSYKKALLWQHSTGSGAYSTEPENTDDDRSPYQRELENRCKFWNQLHAAMGDRAGIMPRRIYSSIESEAMREADLDLRRLLGLARFEDEEDDAASEVGGNVTSMQSQTDPDGASVRGTTDRGKAPDPSQSNNRGSTQSSSRSHRSSTNPHVDIISTYLEGKKEHDKMVMEVETRKLEREEREERRLERKLMLEERRQKHQSQLQRAEIIATFVKAGLNLEQATRAYNEGREEEQQRSAPALYEGDGHRESTKAASASIREPSGPGSPARGSDDDTHSEDRHVFT